MENLTEQQFKLFVTEIADVIEMNIDSYKCPFEDNEHDWRDKDGYWEGKPFCDVEFTKSYEGEIDQYCTGHRGQCYVHYTLESLGVEYDPTIFNPAP